MFIEGEIPNVVTTNGNCNNGGMFGNNGDWIWAFLLFALIGNNGWGIGGGYGGGYRGEACATQADVRAAVDQQTLISKLDQQTYGLADSTYAINNTLNSNFRTLDNAICTLGYQNQAGINSLSAQLAQCCCDNRAAISEVRYDMSKGFCDVIRAGQDNTRAILDYLTGEKIASLTAENSGLKAQISNDRQSAYLLNELKPCPIPAYITCNPNAPYGLGYGVGFGFGSHSGCCGASVQ
jgi:hypothetical protein